jgi:hypothetical protein
MRDSLQIMPVKLSRYSPISLGNLNASATARDKAGVITILAVVYLKDIVWYRLRVRRQRPRDRLQRSFLALSIMTVLAVLNFDDVKRYAYSRRRMVASATR